MHNHQYENVRSHNTPNTPTPAAENTTAPATVKPNNTSSILRKSITIGRAIAFLFGGLFFYLELRLWETNKSVFWEWTKEQYILWIGLGIGLLITLGVLIGFNGFKGIKKWAVNPKRILIMLITLFVIYQIIIFLPHLSVVGEWLIVTFLPTPVTGWIVSLVSILFAFLKVPKIRRKKK